MPTRITLSDSPRRQARITVGEGENLLTWTFDAPGMSDKAWHQLLANGFDTESGRIDHKAEEREALDFRDRIAAVVATLNGAVEQLERNRTFESSDESFIEFARRIIKEDNKSGMPLSRINKYNAAVARFDKYLKSVGAGNILISNITSDTLSGFNNAMSDEGLKPSTRAFYNRTLQALYLRGVKAGLSPDNTPFSKVATQYRHNAVAPTNRS